MSDILLASPVDAPVVHLVTQAVISVGEHPSEAASTQLAGATEGSLKIGTKFYPASGAVLPIGSPAGSLLGSPTAPPRALSAGTGSAGNAAHGTGANPSEAIKSAVDCTQAAADWQQVPRNLLDAILVIEGGKPGQRVYNKNGTYDMGPAQINSIWLPVLAKQGIPEDLVVHDRCVNVFVASWILRQHYVETGDYWAAVGRYHSKTPALNAAYRLRINQVLRP